MAVKRKRRPLSASVVKTLKAKAKKSKRFTYGQLARVFRRGQGAYLSSGSRRGTSMQQWAFGRVNSFIRGGLGGSEERRKKLKDMLEAGNEYLSKYTNITPSQTSPGDIELASHDKPFSKYPPAGGDITTCWRIF